MAGEEKREPEVGKVAAPELRLLDRRAFVAFPPLEVAPGVRITDFGLQIPDVSFPFSISGGALRYQKKTLQFGFLEVTLDAERIRRAVQEVAGAALELEDVQLAFRTGYLEGQARLRGPAGVPATFKVAFDADGERLGVYFYDVRLYGFSPTPAAMVPLLLARAAQSARLLPDVELRGTTGFSARVLPALVQAAAVTRGFRVPSLEGARLTGLDVSATALRLRFASTGLPPPALLDEELLFTLEGARAFAEAEALLAAGKLTDARDAYLRGAEPQDAHPFALERLLGLLVADPGAHELALDVAENVARRRPSSASPQWVEAVIRERRGEPARAAERWLALCNLARKRSEQAAAAAAAEAAARVAEGQAPQMAMRALHELLGLRPDHLPSLQALARAADAASDRAGAIRAYRRISALARDPAESAEAHVHLARLTVLTEDDVAGARLHCEAALRLSPDHPGALELLGELCHRAGEHLRALKALDRLRDVALARHDLSQVGRANLLAGRVWEKGLSNLDNALLRYREAVALLPGDPEVLVAAAHAAEGLGRVSEAVTGYLQGIELAGPEPEAPKVRAAAHQAHRSLAVLERSRLGDAAQARTHLEAALALAPEDAEVLQELIPLYRAQGDPARLATALAQAAPMLAPAARAAALAEAGELQRVRLDNAGLAETLLARALDTDATNRVALEGMLAIAEQRRDGPLLCRCLQSLAAQAIDPAERTRLLRRLAVAARDLAGDLALAAETLAEVLRLEPDDLAALGELCGLQRRRGDMPGLAAALEQRARVAESHRDLRLAAAALRELAQVLESRLGRVGEALVALEKAARLQPEPAVLFELADLSLRCERPEHARRALEDVLASLPRAAPEETVAEVHAKLGRACELLGDAAAAATHYAEALPRRPSDDALAERLEAIYEKLGRTRELGELWATRAQLLRSTGRPEAAAPLLLKSARALLAAGHREAAHQKLYAALELQREGPVAGQVLETLAELELQQGNRPEAAQLLARQAESAGEPRTAAKLFLRAAEVAPDEGRQLAWLDAALRLDPDLLGARLRRGLLRRTASPHAALDDLEAALALVRADPVGLPHAERARLLRGAADAARGAGEPEVARRHLAAYAALEPGDVGAQLELAALHREAGALEALQSLLASLWPRLSGTEANKAARELVTLSVEMGRPDEAIPVLRDLLARDARDVWAAETLLGLLARAPGAAGEEVLSLRTLLTEATVGTVRGGHLVERARLLRTLGRGSEARDDLAAAAREAAEPGALWREVAELAHADGDVAAELAAWRSASAAAPDLRREAAPRMLHLARSLLERGEALEARAAFTEAAEAALDPAGATEAHLGAADAAVASGDLEAASRSLLRASEQGPVAPRVQALLRRAELAEARGAAATASESLERALGLDPANVLAASRLQTLLERSEDWAGVAELLAARASHASKADAARLHAQLGALYLDRLGLPGPAEAALRRAAQLDPSGGEARSRLLRLLVDRGAWEEAAETARQAARLLPAEEGARLLREAAGACARAGAQAEALALRRRAEELSPATGEELRTLAFDLYRAGARAEALPLFAKAARAATFEDTPDRDEELLLAHADLLAASGDEAAAVETLRGLLRERPLSTAAVERLADLLAKENPRESIALLASSLEGRAPSLQVGEMFLALGRRAKAELADDDLALRLFERAARAMPDPVAARRVQVELLRDAGRTAELLDALRTLAADSAEAGDTAGALAALDEVADVAAAAGRGDEALGALDSLRERALGAGERERAARAELRRAELLLSLRRDAQGAEGALRRSFELHPAVATAERAAALAARRDDLPAQAAWLERAVPLHAAPAARAEARVMAADLFLGPLEDAPRAEALLRDALAEAPGHPGAETRLVALLERTGRAADLAAYHASAARSVRDPEARVRALRAAARIHREQLGDATAAVEALASAQALRPGDPALTAELADLLAAAGRPADAAPYDAQLLRSDPFRSPSWERHRAWLASTGDWRAAAALHIARADRQVSAEAAASYLEAARAYRQAGLEADALAAEDRAFAHAPDSDVAFAARRARVAGDPRAVADLLLQRSRAVPSEGPALLAEAAALLAGAGEPLRAAEAWDALLRMRPDDVAALLARGDLAADGGGPQAAQPYDRRALAAGGDTLGTAQRVRLLLRLGHASLAAGALQDAAESLEGVVAADPEGERGRQALFLLGEVYARRPDAAGAFRTALRLARLSGPEEAEALYRRAAELVEKPAEALEALLPLSELRPADAAVVDRAIAGLRQAGRAQELEPLLERAARVSGGGRAAALLLEAAGLARGRGDGEREVGFLESALAAEPANTALLEALARSYRERRDAPALARTLEALVAQRPLDAASARLRLEAARALSGTDAPDRVRALLQPVVDAGPSESYAEALELLEPLLAGAPLAHALALAARAELQTGKERAALLLEAARLAREAGDTARAAGFARSSVATEPTGESLLFLAMMMRDTGEMATAAAALVQAAQLVPAAERPGLLVQAADAWEAAGDPGEARSLLERLAESAPEALLPGDWAMRFLQLGSVESAVRHGYEPLLAQGAGAEALAVAEAIGDRALVRAALWAVSSAAPEPQGVRRLASLVLEDGTAEERLRAARLCEMVRAHDFDSALYRAVLLAPSGPEEDGTSRVEALARLVALGEGDAALWETLERLEPGAPPALVDALAVYARGRRGSERERALRALATRIPARSAPLWAELFQRARDEDRLDDAGTALSGWLEATTDPAQRAALRTQLGDLALHLGRQDEAREAYSQAAAEDPGSAVPLPKLLALTSPEAEPARFVELADRLESLAGPASLAEFRTGLAAAYTQLGQTEEAFRELGELPATTALIAQRAALAEALGRREEAFALREQLAQTPAERAVLGLEAARAGLGERAAELLAGAESELPVEAHREVAERLAASDAGAPIAARLWPSLLVQASLDVVGWTAYAEALRRTGRAEAAVRAESFALAASGELPLSDLPRSVAPVQRPRTVSTHPLPQGALPVDAGTMPELHGALDQALASLGAPEVLVYLDPAGGAEAWLAGRQTLVLGAGALSYFGPAELTFLLALALLLGDEGVKLAGPGPVEALNRVAAAAYTAVPAPLAAARVLVLLDGAVRGADVDGLDVAAVLAASAAFRAVVQRAVALV